MSYSLPMWLLTTVLFVPVGKRSKSRSQMFCKIDALKNLAILTGKHLCWRFFLTTFIKKRHQHRCFPVNIGKCLSTAFYIEHIPFFNTFHKFYVMIKFLGCLRVQNWYFSYFWCYCFVFLHNYSASYCFYTKIFIQCNFATDYNHGSFTVLIELLKLRNNSRIIATYPGNLLRKMWIWGFWLLCYVIIFFRSGLARHG